MSPQRCPPARPRPTSVTRRGLTGQRSSVVRMDTSTQLQPEGLVRSPAFSHVAVVPPGVTTIDATARLPAGDPPLVTSACVAGLGVPGTLVGMSAVAAVP